MKRILLMLLIAVGVLSIVGCLKNDDDYKPCVVKTLEEDMPAMTKFASDSAITTMQDESGILYQIMEPGNATHPTSSSSIVAKYIGRNMSGQLFDSRQFQEPYPLTNLIRGWQIVLPKIGVGGKMKMIVPSSLAYGCNAPDIRVLNQPLYFYVELVSVQ